ncbi:MAG: metal-sensing transcriptional repressor, partial [Oligoflexales bacterium]|nr:metal-sensing transcriptional repressor [Oligoflexales bacterium]
LKGIESMMQQREYCMDIFQQTRAARNAIKALEAKILKTHLETCVSEAILTKDRNEIEIKIEEIVGLFSKF